MVSAAKKKKKRHVVIEPIFLTQQTRCSLRERERERERERNESSKIYVRERLQATRNFVMVEKDFCS